MKLPKIKMDGKEWFIDRQLGQIRNVNNRHEWEMVSLEIIDYWLEHNITDLDTVKIG